MSPEQPQDRSGDRSAKPTQEATSTGSTSESATPLRITGLASGGEGVGRFADGQVVFVDGGVPGDLIEVCDLKLKKKLMWGRVGRVLESSPDRVEPRCSHFGVCGGCRWQHLRYEAQLDAKRVMIGDALSRIGGLTLDREIEIVGSPDEYGYRARARLVESKGELGYRERGSREATVIRECPILVPAAQKKLGELVIAIGPTENAGLGGADDFASRTRRRDKEWILTAGNDQSIAIETVTGKSAQRRKGEPKGKSDKASAVESVTIEVLGERLRVNSKSFMQGNALLWDALAEEVCLQCTLPNGSGSGEGSPKRFVELYAGVGFLTRPLARRGLKGVVIESDPYALADLKVNLAEKEIAGRVQIISGRVETRRDLAGRLKATDVLLVDPPRTGLDAKVRDAIASAGPARVVYVSCDPATLARDLKVLVASGYSLASLRALDLFPQTPHVEIVTRLERASARVRKGSTPGTRPTKLDES